MKCILHIGTEKTGTTLLQAWLYENRSVLGAHGIYLTDTLGKPNNRLLPAYIAPRLDDWTRRNRITTLEEKDRFFAGFEERVAAEISNARKEHDHCVITSEHLHSRIKRRGEIEEVRAFLGRHFDEIAVVCYFREQSAMARSLYSTALKGESTQTFEEFCRNVHPGTHEYNFKRSADDWSGSFGRDACEFRIYDRRRFQKGDIRMDFMSILPDRLDASSLSFAKGSANESLGGLEASIYRKINELVPYWLDGEINDRNVALKAAVSRLERVKSGRVRFAKGPEIAARFHAVNQEFFASYFDGEYLFEEVHDERPGDAPPVCRDEEDLVLSLLSALLQVVAFPPSLKDDDGAFLRDLALKYESQQAPSLQDAARLMELARRARPGGPFIKRKLAEYSSRLKAMEADD